jgi:hypothetical protein
MTVPAPALSALPGSLLTQPQFLFFIFVGVAWLFKAISRAKAAFLKEEPPQREVDRQKPAEQAGPVEMSLSDEERALLVRQDILQKRAKRQAEAAALMRMGGERQAPAPPALARRAPTESPAAPTKGSPAAAVPGALVQSPAVAPRIGSLAAEAPAPSAGALWLNELRARDSVRRAILVREILGAPVALR